MIFNNSKEIIMSQKRILLFLILTILGFAVVHIFADEYYVDAINGTNVNTGMSSDDAWQTITIPLANFSGLVDTSSLTEFVIVFEDRMATNKDGIIYIDNIRFTN